MKDKASAMADAGKYVLLVARKDGTWRVIRDSDNPAALPATAASAN